MCETKNGGDGNGALFLHRLSSCRYMFGAGTHGQFAGAGFAHAFEQSGRVLETWARRVAQDPKFAGYMEEKQRNAIRAGVESKPE